MKVEVNRATDVPLDHKALRKTCLRVLRREKVRRDAVLSLTAVSEAAMRDLNRRFLKREGSTDVLAFPMGEESREGYLLGDVVICPEYVLRNPRVYGVAKGRELEFVVAHGVLHLLGYDDREEGGALEMERRQRAVLGLAGEEER